MGRPSQPLLSPEKIHRAALDLVDESGDFTLPGLGRRLRVSPSSIYHHVEGRSDIINGMRSLISRGVLAHDDFPPGTGDWREQVARWARIYRRSLGEHAAAIPLFVGEMVTDAPTLEIYERLSALLSAQGFTPRAVAVAVSVVDSFMLGSAMDSASPNPAWKTDAAVHPVMHDALALGGLGALRPDVSFEAGISILVRNLEVMTEIASFASGGGAAADSSPGAAVVQPVGGAEPSTAEPSTAEPR